MTNKTLVLVFLCDFLAFLTALLLVGAIAWWKLKAIGAIW